LQSLGLGLKGSLRSRRHGREVGAKTALSLSMGEKLEGEGPKTNGSGFGPYGLAKRKTLRKKRDG